MSSIGQILTNGFKALGEQLGLIAEDTAAIRKAVGGGIKAADPQTITAIHQKPDAVTFNNTNTRAKVENTIPQYFRVPKPVADESSDIKIIVHDAAGESWKNDKPEPVMPKKSTINSRSDDFLYTEGLQITHEGKTYFIKGSEKSDALFFLVWDHNQGQLPPRYTWVRSGEPIDYFSLTVGSHDSEALRKKLRFINPDEFIALYKHLFNTFNLKSEFAGHDKKFIDDLPDVYTHLLKTTGRIEEFQAASNLITDWRSQNPF